MTAASSLICDPLENAEPWLHQRAEVAVDAPYYIRIAENCARFEITH